MIKVNCTGNGASAACDQWLTCGTVGAVCEFSFDSTWDGLRKTAVFTDGNTQRDVLLTENRCVIPWEVLTQAGAKLCVGVYGADTGGEVVVPTIYANVGEIRPGAEPGGDPSAEPTLPVWAQICSEIGELRDLATAEKNNLVAAINEAAQSGGGGGGGSGGGGSGTSDHRQLTNRDAANQHPISAITGLQSQLDGKQPAGNYALYSEVQSVRSEVDEKQNTLLQGGASVGQIAKIASVDASGKPTAWQAVNMPQGGGGEECDYEKEIVITEETAGFVLNTFDDSTPLKLDEVWIDARIKNSANAAASVWVRISVVGTSKERAVTWGTTADAFLAASQNGYYSVHCYKTPNDKMYFDAVTGVNGTMNTAKKDVRDYWFVGADYFTNRTLLDFISEIKCEQVIAGCQIRIKGKRHKEATI